MSEQPQGIHHVTCIAGDAQRNLDFYAGILGMRLVKRSVNQDDPGTYHLFYADAEGHPGTDLTFFPWPGLPAGRNGAGQAAEVQLAVPGGSLSYWRERLERYDVEAMEPETRFEAPALPLRDPDGLHVALVATDAEREFAPWSGSPVPEHVQVRGIHGMRVLELRPEETTTFLTDVLGFEEHGRDGAWRRYGLHGGGSGTWLDVAQVPGGAEAQRALGGRGSVHHIAWRVPDEERQRELRQRIADAAVTPTDVIDRFWFRSVYFREPGGVLFELATDGPGFGVDEDMDSLGERLILPPWLEAHRERIERALPPLSYEPTGAGAD